TAPTPGRTEVVAFRQVRHDIRHSAHRCEAPRPPTLPPRSLRRPPHRRSAYRRGGGLSADVRVGQRENHEGVHEYSPSSARISRVSRCPARDASNPSSSAAGSSRLWLNARGSRLPTSSFDPPLGNSLHLK